MEHKMQKVILKKYTAEDFSLSALLDLSRKNGYARVTAITDPANEYSRRLLENAAFVFEKEYINEDGDPAVIYRLNNTDEPFRQEG